MTKDIVFKCEIEDYANSINTRFFGSAFGSKPQTPQMSHGMNPSSQLQGVPNSYLSAQKDVLQGQELDKLIKDFQTDATTYRPRPTHKRFSADITRETGMFGGREKSHTVSN